VRLVALHRYRAGFTPEEAGTAAADAAEAPEVAGEDDELTDPQAAKPRGGG